MIGESGSRLPRTLVPFGRAQSGGQSRGRARQCDSPQSFAPVDWSWFMRKSPA